MALWDSLSTDERESELTLSPEAAMSTVGISTA
jgi:hypothetical protein